MTDLQTYGVLGVSLLRCSLVSLSYLARQPSINSRKSLISQADPAEKTLMP